MAGSTAYFDTKQVEYLRGTALGTPPSLYIGLNSADSNDGSSEVTSTYLPSRAAYTGSSFGSPTTVGTNRVITNSTAVALGTSIAPSTGISHFSIWDAISEGNCLFVGTFVSGSTPTPLVFSSGIAVSIPVNTLTISLSITSHSIYLRDIYLNWIKGTSAPTAPTTYAGIATAAAADGTVTEVTTTVRVAGRVLVSAWDAIATLGNYKFTINTNAINFGSSAGAVTGVTHFPLWDAASGGNLLVFPALASPRDIGIGNPVSLDAGKYKIQQR